jgi:N-methylhydantoinase B
VNAVRAITHSAVNYVFRCLAPPELPTNAGVMRPVTVITRPGTVVDAEYPAAVAAGNVETSQRIVDAVLMALGQAVDELPAASQGTMNNLAIGGAGRGGQFSYYETTGGGCGAGRAGQGADATHSHMTNTLNTPVEALEHAYPLRVAEYSIRRGSGGPGNHRGGDGIRRRIEALAECEAVLLTERRTNAPYGRAGGKPGMPGKNTLLTTGGDEQQLPGKCTVELNPGDQLIIETPGGGGWGSADGQD